MFTLQSINGISIDVTQLSTSRLIELKFDPVRREHHGNYTCLAKNLADTASSIAQLTVKCNFKNSSNIFISSFLNLR